MKKSIFIVVATVAALAMLSLLSACGGDAPLPTNDRELLAYRSEGEYTVWSFNIPNTSTRRARTCCVCKRSRSRNTTTSKRH